MNTEEFKERSLTLAVESGVKQRLVYEDLSYDDIKEYLLSKEWTVKEETEFGSFFYRPGITGIGHNPRGAFMQQKREEERKARKEAIKDRTAECKCNKCGADLEKKSKSADGEEHSWGYYGMVDEEVDGGYGSDPLCDGMLYRFSLCESCLHELFLSFIEMPEIISYMP